MFFSSIPLKAHLQAISRKENDEQNPSAYMVDALDSAMRGDMWAMGGPACAAGPKELTLIVSLSLLFPLCPPLSRMCDSLGKHMLESSQKKIRAKYKSVHGGRPDLAVRGGMWAMGGPACAAGPKASPPAKHSLPSQPHARADPLLAPHLAQPGCGTLPAAWHCTAAAH
jgi:hypothetical protein